MVAEKEKTKAWVVSFLVITLGGLIAIGMFNVFIDPLFHYHKPIEGLAYHFGNERYINNGITRHFEYDAMITGSSMTECFKTSECDELFGVKSIKVPCSGALYKEINDAEELALKYNPNLQMIIRGLDYNGIIQESDACNYTGLPDYLYDEEILNDVNYVWNRDTLIRSLTTVAYTCLGAQSENFDEYQNWGDTCLCGKDVVLEGYERPDQSETIHSFSEEDKRLVEDNISQNILKLAEDHPQVELYYFFTPYSIVYWDGLNQSGDLLRQLDAEKYAIELMLQYDNIHLFAFNDEFDMICDLDNYKDAGHYNGAINTQILKWMSQDQHRLTKDNYQSYCDRVKEFYTGYNYDDLFEESE